MSALRLFDKFKALLDVNWGSIADGQFLKRSGSNIVGAASAGSTPDNVLIGDTAQGTYPATSIIVPSFKAHPDGIITSPSAFDDHFDGTSLNAKWTVDAPDGFRTVVVGGSHVVINGFSQLNDSLFYTASISQTLPNANNFRLALKLNRTIMTHTLTSSLGLIDLDLLSTTPAVMGLKYRYTFPFYSGVGSQENITLYTGANTATQYAQFYGGLWAPYLRLVWVRSTWTLTCEASLDGKVWTLIHFPLSSAVSGFSETYLPQKFSILAGGMNFGQAIASVDWVTFSNF